MVELTNETNETEIPNMKIQPDDERIVSTIDENVMGLCPCGYKHYLNGKYYDFVFIRCCCYCRFFFCSALA